MDTIGHRLKVERTRRGFSQEDLAALSSVSPLTIMRIEQNRSKPRLDTIRKLAEALSLPAESLAFGLLPPMSAIENDDGIDIGEIRVIASHITASAHDMLNRLRTLESLDTLPVKERAKVQLALKRQEAQVRKMDRWNATLAQVEGEPR